jgi:hypothetical protein
MSIDSDKNYEIENIINRLEIITRDFINKLIELTEDFDNYDRVCEAFKNQVIRMIDESKYQIRRLYSDICGYEDELGDNVKVYERKIIMYLFRLIYSNNCRTMYCAFYDLKKRIDVLIDNYIELTLPKYNNIYGNEKLHNFLLEIKYNL